MAQEKPKRMTMYYSPSIAISEFDMPEWKEFKKTCAKLKDKKGKKLSASKVIMGMVKRFNQRAREGKLVSLD